jgi:hypothetical protein
MNNSKFHNNQHPNPIKCKFFYDYFPILKRLKIIFLHFYFIIYLNYVQQNVKLENVIVMNNEYLKFTARNLICNKSIKIVEKRFFDLTLNIKQ